LSAIRYEPSRAAGRFRLTTSRAIGQFLDIELQCPPAELRQRLLVVGVLCVFAVDVLAAVSIVA